MANTLYDSARSGFLGGDIDWTTGEQRVALTRGYTPLASHSTLDTFTASGGTIGVYTTLTGMSTTDGYARADNVTFPTVSAGAPFTGLLVYQHTLANGSAAPGDSSRFLVCCFDTGMLLPLTPTGVDIEITWNASFGLFRL
jgi:hypothetical protein